jgi:muramidase (phage lysozyme)
MLWTTYSFEPEYQDVVVYRWLNDSQFWRTNISQQLRQGKLDDVLKRLSPTWTSLGYGIETNSRTQYLPKIYQKMLQEELTVDKKGKGQRAKGKGSTGSATSSPCPATAQQCVTVQK